MMRKYLIYFLVTTAANVFAQAPVINSIQPLNAGPNQKIAITGNGFDATAANNLVWFDHVAGKVTAATPYSLEATVPSGARFSNVEVINKTNGLSAKSQLKFLPSYGGVSFVVADTKLAKVDSANVEFFDIASADFDLDGDVDMVTSRGGPTSSSAITDIYVYQNVGTGIGSIKFTRTPFTVGAPTANVACGDLNGDGKPDIIASRGGTTRNEIFILKNTNNGTPGNLAFAPKVVKSLDALQSAFRLSIRDLNGDGKPEIISSNASSTCTGNITSATNSTTVTGTGSLFLSELFVGSILYNASGTAIGTIASIASNTSLTLTANATVLVTNGAYSKSNQIYIFPNNSSVATISFGVPIKLNVIGALNTYGLDVQDLDGDTKPDIIVNQFQGPNIFIFKNSSTGTISFDPVSTPMASSATGSYNNIISSDLNGDGLLDLIATSTVTDQIQYWINNSTSGAISFDNATTKKLSTSVGPWGVDVSDIDGDGDADIIVSNNSAPPPRYNPADIKINVFRQDGPLSFNNRFDIVASNVQRNLRVGDYDGDGKPDIAFTSGVGTTFRVDVIRNKNCWDPKVTGPSTKICALQTIKLQTQPVLGANYDWKFNGASQGVNANTYNATGALGSGNYTVTLTGVADLNCTNTSPNYSVTVDNASAFPKDPVIHNNTPCLGSNLNLQAKPVPTATYNWSGPNNFSKNGVYPDSTATIPSVTTAAAGVYSLQLTLANGCQSNVITQQLDVYSVPILPVTASPSAIGCVGGSITLSVSGSGYNFQWTKNGSTITTNSSANTTLSLTPLSASDEGDYSVLVQSVASTCIQETAKSKVQVFAAPVVDFSFSSPQCKGETITFTDLTTGADSRGALSYEWNFGDGTPHYFLQSPPPQHIYGTVNTFSGVSLRVSYTADPTCFDDSPPKSIQIFDPVVPVIQASANPICKGDETTLSITGSYNSISWSGGALTGNSSSVIITDSTTYIVNTLDNNNCTGTDTIQVTINPAFTPFSISTYKNKKSVSPGDTIKLSATAGADSYLWSPTETLTDVAISNPVATPIVTTKYLVTARKTGSCAKDSIIVNVGAEVAIINPPVLFSPNGDSKNDTWKLCYMPSGSPCPEETKYHDWTMTIFDGHGSQVYQQKGFTQWDGGSAPDGVYYYVFSSSQGKPATGSVLLVRQKQ